MEELRYLQPKQFTFEDEGFVYEVVACHEYYSDFLESDDGDESGAELDFSGNYIITILTPQGTMTTQMSRDGDTFEDEDGTDSRLAKHIIEQIITKLSA